MSNFMPPQKQQQQQQPQMGGGVGPAISAIGLQAAEVSKRPACACVWCVRASLPRAMKIFVVDDGCVDFFASCSIGLIKN